MSIRKWAPRWVVSWAIAVSLVGAGPALARGADYQLGYGDALTISIVGQPSLSVEAQAVRPDGRISLPLVQEVEIAGKTVAELTADLVKAYKPYLLSPQIVVSVAKFRPLKVTVLGQVTKPGTYDFEAHPTLVDALATAGGLTERAQRGAIKVMTPGQPAQVYDLDRLLSGESELPRLAEGSVVEIAEVWGPDYYRLIPIVASIITAGALLWRYSFSP